MLLDVCLGTRSAWKILMVMAEAPGKAVSRKEIQQLTKLGNKVIMKFLLLLEKFGFIHSKKIGKTYYYTFYLSNPFVEQIIQIIAVEKKALNNPEFFILNILRDFVYELTNINLDNLEKVIFFGSYAKRTSHADSDIDVAIVFKEINSDDELLITAVVRAINKRYACNIQPHYFTQQEIRQKKDKLVLEILKDGIVLL